MKTEKLDPTHVEWSRNHFSTLADGGVWGVPRSGLIFTKRDGKLVLTEKMPHIEGMSVSPEKLARFQREDFNAIRRYFEAAGVTVEDAT